MRRKKKLENVEDRVIIELMGMINRLVDHNKELTLLCGDQIQLELNLKMLMDKMGATSCFCRLWSMHDHPKDT